MPSPLLLWHSLDIMKKSYFFLIALLVVLAVVFTYLPQEEKGPEEGISVAATVFPLADIAQNVAGEEISVFTLVAPGSSPHTFEPRPSDVQKLQQSNLLISVGLDLDDWAVELARGVPGISILTPHAGIHILEGEHHHGEEHEEGDPHYWLSPENAKIIAANIAESLASLDPENAETYRGNAEAYQEELDSMYQETRSMLSSLPTKSLVVFHDSWRYFAEAYDLQIGGVFESSPGKEPSPQYLQDLYDTAQELGAGTIFIEPQLSSSAIESFAQDLNLEVSVLDPLGGVEGRNSYLELIRYNAEEIFHAFGE